MKIDLRDMQDGENVFTFEETPEDLHIHNDDISFIGPIQSHLVVYKMGESLSAKGETTCLVRPECARCLEPIDLTIRVSYLFVFQKGSPDRPEEEDDETLIWLSETPGEVDLGEEVKDYILLEMPMTPTCLVTPSGPCERYDQDPNELLGHKQEKDIDPRWEALRTLKNDPETNN